MSMETPLATLRLTSDLLDPSGVRRILLDNREDLAPSTIYGFEIKSRNGVWLASTDNMISPRPKDHLSSLINLLASKLSELRTAFPDLVIDFSLIVFDPTFRLGELPQSLLATVTEIGRFEVEMPQQGKGIVFTAQSSEQYVV